MTTCLLFIQFAVCVFVNVYQFVCVLVFLLVLRFEGVVGWLFWVSRPFETVFQSISGR